MTYKSKLIPNITIFEINKENPNPDSIRHRQLLELFDGTASLPPSLYLCVIIVTC